MLSAKRWQREIVEVPSEHDSGCDLDDNLYLHFNYSIQKKKEFWESKIGERKSIKEKQNRQEKKQIL